MLSLFEMQLQRGGIKAIQKLCAKDGYGKVCHGRKIHATSNFDVCVFFVHHVRICYVNLFISLFPLHCYSTITADPFTSKLFDIYDKVWQQGNVQVGFWEFAKLLRMRGALNFHNGCQCHGSRGIHHYAPFSTILPAQRQSIQTSNRKPMVRPTTK